MTTSLPLNQISASDAAAAIAAGKLTSEALVAACLARIEARESAVQAWAHLNPDLALGEARSRDREPARSRLHGIPVGVKDVIDTCDMPTEIVEARGEDTALLLNAQWIRRALAG